MKIHLPLALVVSLAATSSALSFLIRTPARFAVLNLSDSAYIQMEVRGSYVSSTPRIDSMKLEFSKTSETDWETGLLRRVANLRLWWSVVPTGDTGLAIHDVQITRALADSTFIKERGHAVRIDTVFHLDQGWDEFTPVVGIPHVDNSNSSPRILTMSSVMCRYEEPSERKARLLEEFATRWETKRFRTILEPVRIATLVYVSPWSRTDGTEDLPGIVRPMPGNRGNWVDVQTQTFAASEVPQAVVPEGSVTGTVIKRSGMYTLPTGFARYVYNRTNDPDLRIMEPDGPRRIDGVYKVGPTLYVSGSTRDLSDGDLPGVDSLMGRSSWLVLADSSDTPSVERAMWPTPGHCGNRERTTAWRIEDRTVWLDQTTTIDLSELVATLSSTSATPQARSGASASARVAKAPGGIAVDLAQPASVRVTTLSGRVLRELSLDAGSHSIRLGDARGLILVQVSKPDRNETHAIVR